MKSNEPSQNVQVQSGKQVLFRLILFVVGTTVLILVAKLFLG